MISAIIALFLLQASATPPGSPASLRSPGSPPVNRGNFDVSALKVGAPVAVGELDLGKLKGDLRQVGWSPDGAQFYIQTSEGNSTGAKLHHYVIAVAGGVVTGVDSQPDWAGDYWAFKSDRSAPGIGSLMIDLDQKYETLKVGTGQAGALDREATPVGGNVGNIETLAKGNDQNQKALVFRLMLLGEAVSTFVNEKPIPGLMFSWGPEKSGAIAFTDPDGRLILMDQNRHKHAVSSARNALLPAWSMDGQRIAWVQKSGRKKFSLMYATVDR